MTTIASFPVGSQAAFEHLITADDIRRFVEITGDDNPLHVDPAFAATTNFKSVVAHGMLSASFISTMIGKHIPGPGALWMSQSLEFLLPVRIGDRLTISARVTAVQETMSILTLATEIRNQHDQVVLTGESRVKLLATTAPSTPDLVDASIRVAVVTGASRGIGAETARRLAARGYSVIVNFRSDEAGARQVVDEIQRADGRALAVRADIGVADDIRRLIDAAGTSFGGLTALVNNASAPLTPKPFASLTMDDLTKQFDSHVFGPFRVIQQALPLLERQAGAAVVNVSSIYADNVPAPQLAPYAAAKSALVSLTRSLALEYGPKGIRFNAVAPGMTDTAMIGNVPDKARMLARMQAPLRRIASPVDVANGIVFLLSDDARHITGETLRIAGGAVML